MFESIKDMLVHFISQPYIQNLSAFIQATVAASVAIYGLFSFNKWAKQKFYEKRSDYADEALSHLEPAHEEIIHLLREPHALEWNQSYSHAFDEFKKGRRKANRIGDHAVNAQLKEYEEIVRTIQSNHIQRVDDVFMGKDKAIADERLSHSIGELKKLYSLYYEELTKMTLINADHF